MSVTVTCYGGVEEIGGNKILLEDGDVRLFFDFGIPFGRQQEYFNEFLRPRAARGLLDLLALGLIPPLEGIYRDDLALPGLWARFRGHPHYRDLRRASDPALDGVLISHGHLDHNGDLSYLDPAIPVHTSVVTAMIARAMQITGLSNFERELAYTSQRVVSEGGELVSDRRSPYLARAYAFVDGELPADARELWNQSPAKTKKLEPAPAEACSGHVGGLPLRWWPVDHSIPGAVAFAVQTSAGWVGFTGDIRCHGRHGERTMQCAQGMAGLNLVVLLCEGTHYEADRVLTEAEIVGNAGGLVRDADGRLVVADFAPRNLERLLSFLEVAQQTSRTLLAQPKDLYLLQASAMAGGGDIPDPTTLPRLAMYDDPKAAPRSWEKRLREEWAGETISAAGVSAEPGSFILAFSLWDANDLLDLEGVAGGSYLYSNSRAYDDEQKADLERLRNWVRRMDFTLHGDPDDEHTVPLHASGHAPGPQLLEFVETVRPQLLIPIHTENPIWWKGWLRHTGIAVRPPELGASYSLP